MLSGTPGAGRAARGAAARAGPVPFGGGGAPALPRALTAGVSATEDGGAAAEATAEADPTSGIDVNVVALPAAEACAAVGALDPTTAFATEGGALVR